VKREKERKDKLELPSNGGYFIPTFNTSTRMMFFFGGFKSFLVAMTSFVQTKFTQ
jgi:hypothetical protein